MIDKKPLLWHSSIFLLYYLDHNQNIFIRYICSVMKLIKFIRNLQINFDTIYSLFNPLKIIIIFHTNY